MKSNPPAGRKKCLRCNQFLTFELYKLSGKCSNTKCPEWRA